MIVKSNEKNWQSHNVAPEALGKKAKAKKKPSTKLLWLMLDRNARYWPCDIFNSNDISNFAWSCKSAYSCPRYSCPRSRLSLFINIIAPLSPFRTGLQHIGACWKMLAEHTRKLTLAFETFWRTIVEFFGHPWGLHARLGLHNPILTLES